MTSFYRDELDNEIDAVLQRVNRGIEDADQAETMHVDLKEEAGRRGPQR
ncbi:hypothetical protein [Corynebacterium sp. A21]